MTCHLQGAGTIDLYFYDELPAGERTAVEDHLATCASCREALAELREIQEALATRPDVSAPAGGNWTAFMARLDAAIGSDTVVRFERPAVRTHHYAGYLAMAALLALVTMSVLWAARWRVQPARTGNGDVAGAAIQAPAAKAEEVAALTTASEEHLERSKLVVLGLAAKDSREISGADWAYERQLASRLLGDTRLYRLAAEDRGMRNVADVMRDLELVLLEVSMADQSDPDTLNQVQRLIEKRDLVQKMRMNTAGL